MLLLGAWWDEALGGLVPLRPEDTGLGFWIWCWCAPAASGEARVAVTRTSRLVDGDWSLVALRPALRVVDGEPLSGRDLDRLARWLRANGAAVERYWRQETMFTADFLRILVPLAP
jgi:hypothetical protein